MNRSVTFTITEVSMQDAGVKVIADDLEVNSRKGGRKEVTYNIGTRGIHWWWRP